MISSPQGNEVQEKLYNKETPFLYYYHPNSDKFTPYMESIATAVGECSVDANLTGMNNEINQILSAGANANLTAKLNSFRAALTEYHTYLREIKRKMDAFGIGDIGKSYELCSGSVCQKYSAKEIVKTSWEAHIPYFTDKGDRQSLDIVGQAMRLKTQLLETNPKIKESARFWQSLPDLTKNTSILQTNVAKSQHELYMEMYRRTAASGPNPCRDFKL